MTRTTVLSAGATSLLLLLELENRGLLDPGVDRRWLRSFNNSTALFDEDWLFTYEAARRKWLRPAKGKSVVQADLFFRGLAANGVSFFDPDRLPNPLFSPKRESFRREKLDSNVDLGDDFKYAERTKSYQGSEVPASGDDDDNFPDTDDEETPF